MTVTEPIIARAVFGLPESAFPPDGLPHRAVWPVIQSAPDRRFSTVTTSVRRHMTWWLIRRHAAAVVDLELFEPPP